MQPRVKCMRRLLTAQMYEFKKENVFDIGTRRGDGDG